MAVAVTINDQIKNGNLLSVFYTLVFSGNYVAAGEAPAMAAGGLKTSRTTPKFAAVLGKAGYVYAWDYATGKVLVFFGDNNNASDGPLIEIPAAAYPAGVTGDVIKGHNLYTLP